ncbi:MAG: zf-TFIIB domain-containing protein, partial [Deltaproteobacteria bacterium]|nr:zf-TFIIB domain-containing protein [Deltaproteobacteria bacterium]
SDLILERCLRCDGIWLNRGKMRQYKRHQKKVQLEKLGAEAIIRKIPEVYDNPKSWILTGTRGMMAYPRLANESAEELKPDFRGLLKSILQTLLRVAIGI